MSIIHVHKCFIHSWSIIMDGTVSLVGSCHLTKVIKISTIWVNVIPHFLISGDKQWRINDSSKKHLSTGNKAILSDQTSLFLAIPIKTLTLFFNYLEYSLTLTWNCTFINTFSTVHKYTSFYIIIFPGIRMHLSTQSQRVIKLQNLRTRWQSVQTVFNLLALLFGRRSVK